MEAFGYPAWWTPPQSERKAAQAPVALPFQSGNVDAGRRACRKLLARDTGSPGGTGQENVADASWRSPRGSPASFSSAIPTASPFRSLACSDADVYDGAQALMALRNTPSPSLAPASSPPHPSRPAPPPASSPLDTPTKIAKTSSPTSTSPLVSSTPTSSLVVSVSQCAVQMRSLGKKRYLIRPAPRIVVRHEAEDTCGGMYVRAELVQGDDEQVCERALDGDIIEVPLSSALSTEVTFSRLCCMIMPKKLQQNGKLRLKFTLHCNCHNTAARQSPIPHAWCLSSPFRLFSNYGQMTAHQRTEFMQSSSRPRSALASPLALPPAPLPLPPSPSTPSSTATLVVAAVCTVACASAARSSSAVRIDGATLGRQYMGIGGLSGGGATSRLLVSYPKKQRDLLLDILFKPHFAASLNILKVEIGGDAQSTDGSESSHMHSADDLNYKRGYEWWLMQEAKARNPDIVLYGLPWAWPGWVGKGTGSPYADPTLPANYILKWIEGARDVYDLHIDWVGCWNERAYDANYLKTLRKTLDTHNCSSTQIVAADRGWDVATAMLKDPELDAAIGAVGAHYPGVHSSDDAKKTGKPLWASEDMSTYDDSRGAQCWARILNQNYVVGNMTSTISWNLIASYYRGLLWYGTALMTAASPWSGSYNLENMGLIWATAHTTQFVKMDWHYLPVGSGSGLLSKGGSYATLTDGKDKMAMIIEKMPWAHSQCIRPPLPQYDTESETMQFHLTGPLAAVKSLYVRRTRFGWDGLHQTENHFFELLPSINVTDGSFSLTIRPDELYTLSNVGPGTKGEFPDSPPEFAFPTDYSDDFDSYEDFQEASYFADQAGVWEIRPAQDSSRGKIMRQVVPERPVTWSGDYSPFSVMGDSAWARQTVQVDVLIETATPGAAMVVARSRICCQPAGIFFAIDSATQTWTLARRLDLADVIVSGPYDVETDHWYTLRLEVDVNTITASIDGKVVANKHDAGHTIVTTGWPAIATGLMAGTKQNFVFAQFDRFSVAGAQEQRCVEPHAGGNLTMQRCGGSTAPTSQWTLKWPTSTTLQLALKSNEKLCASAQTNIGRVALADCAASSDPQQTFTVTPNSGYPWVSLQTGSHFVGAQPGNVANIGTYDPDSHIVLVGGSLGLVDADAPAAAHAVAFDAVAQRLRMHNSNECVAVNKAGTTSFVRCSGVDAPEQQFVVGVNATLVHASTGACLTLSDPKSSDDATQLEGHHSIVVHTQPCASQSLQQWRVDTTSTSAVVRSVARPAFIFAPVPNANSGQWVLDEFSQGQITPYGPNVPQFCMAQCDQKLN